MNLSFNSASVIWTLGLIIAILAFTANQQGLFPAWLQPWLNYATGLLGLIMAYLKQSPAKEPPREEWSSAMRGVKTGRNIRVLLVMLALLPFMQGCHGPINIQTNPVGAVAHYGKQVVDIVQSVQDAVIAAQKAKLPGVTVERIAPVIRATIEVGKQGQNLAKALTELDALPIGDLTRPTKTKAIGVILASMNALIFNMVVPVGDDPLLIKIRDLVREVSVLLLTVQQQLLPPAPAAPPASTSHGRHGPLVPVPSPVLCPVGG